VVGHVKDGSADPRLLSAKCQTRPVKQRWASTRVVAGGTDGSLDTAYPADAIAVETPTVNTSRVALQ